MMTHEEAEKIFDEIDDVFGLQEVVGSHASHTREWFNAGLKKHCHEEHAAKIIDAIIFAAQYTTAPIERMRTQCSECLAVWLMEEEVGGPTPWVSCSARLPWLKGGLCTTCRQKS